MAASEVAIDANLLVLLTIGAVRPDLVGRHKRVRAYTVEDYEVVLELVNAANRVWVTPNALAEASNLLGFGRRNTPPEFAMGLRQLVESVLEIYVPSEQVADRAEFGRLGLNDAALLELVTPERSLLTMDAKLYVAALAIDPGGAVNVAHLLRRNKET